MMTVTEAAADKIAELLQQHPNGGVRVGTVLGGCAGIRYTLGLEPKPTDEDVVVRTGGAAVFLAPDSAVQLEDAVMDFVTVGGSSGFTFDNPNAVGRCSCSDPNAPCAK